jgi:hypothetical protein
MVLEGSPQAGDVQGGKAPSDIYGDPGIARVKTYVKPDDMERLADGGRWPRSLEFDQPFQVAAERTGCTWGQGNRAFMVQFAGCNLDCPYCFIGDANGGEVVEVGAGRVFDAYTQHLDAEEDFAAVVRVSGGEPFLQQEAICAIIRERERRFPGMVPYLWIDTNLTIMPNDDLRSMLMDVGRAKRMAVCGCFKPHRGPDLVSRQLAVAAELVEASVDLFLYWPCELEVDADDVPGALSGSAMTEPLFKRWRDQGYAICKMLDETLVNASLRTTFLVMKYHYEAMVAGGFDYAGCDPKGWTELARQKAKHMRAGQRAYWQEQFPASLRWLPSHQIPLSLRNPF